MGTIAGLWLLKARAEGMGASHLNRLISRSPSSGSTLADVIRVSSDPRLHFRMGHGPEAWLTPRRPVEEISSLEG